MQRLFGDGLVQRIRHGHSLSAEEAAQTMAPTVACATLLSRSELLADPINRAVGISGDWSVGLQSYTAIRLLAY